MKVDNDFKLIELMHLELSNHSNLCPQSILNKCVEQFATCV